MEDENIGASDTIAPGWMLCRPKKGWDLSEKAGVVATVGEDDQSCPLGRFQSEDFLPKSFGISFKSPKALDRIGHVLKVKAQDGFQVMGNNGDMIGGFESRFKALNNIAETVARHIDDQISAIR
jgi:hypothetical protein